MIRKETLIGLFGILTILLALAVFRNYMLNTEHTYSLREIYAPCPTCYEPCYGMNNEVVCRNPECPEYGLPQFIPKYVS